MVKKKQKKNIYFGPVITIIILTFVIMGLSFLFDIFQIQGEKTSITNGGLETTVTTANSILSKDGIKYIFNNVLVNFNLFEPLVTLIIVLIGLGIGEASGLFKKIFTPLRKLKPKVLIFLTLFVGIISTFLGDYSYMLLLPLVGIIYKYIDRNAMLGIITVFIGITLGYGTGVIYNYDISMLGDLTTLSATLDVDPNYQYHTTSALYIMIVSTFILAYIGTLIIDYFLKPKIKKSIKDETEYIDSNKAFSVTVIVFVILLLLVGYMISPGLPFSGILLDNSQPRYIFKLFSDTAPFKDGIVLIVTLILMICGFIYGYLSGNIKNSNDYSVGLSKSFDGLGYVFVLMFFVSQMVGILNYTNLGEVIATKLVDFMSVLELSGLPLILIFIFVTIIISLFIPTTITKWIIMSPIIIPLFMRANITPDFTQFIFQIADGIGKSFTPLFVYFIIMVAFLQKYNGDEKTKITIFGTLKTMMPTLLLLASLWILIIVGWYIINLPIGIGMYPTL